MLASRYRLDRQVLSDSLLAFLDIPTVHVDQQGDVRDAIAQHRAGADLADMLHVLAARGAESLLTFDRTFAKRAEGMTPPVELLSV